jgi:nicotinate phosphoribosyltransferase
MIINSLLDLDYYKLTMMQLAFFYYRDVEVEYAFKNRTSTIKLADVINQEALENELKHIQSLKFTEEELNWIKSQKHQREENSPILTPTFKPEFIEYLRTFEMSDFTLGLDEDGEYDIRSRGSWCDSILWETLILSTVNEAYYISKYQNRSQYITAGTQNNFEVVSTLLNYPNLPFIDFGTRRRFSGEWQKNVVDILNGALPKTTFTGTSNCKLAMDLQIPVSGTNAHEMYMIATGIFRDNMREGHSTILDQWYELYGWGLSIALTDTFGTKYFFEDFGEERARKWKGLRQDSGDPVEFGEKAIKFYESHGIDPTTKLIVFSDGLSLEKMIKLYNHFNGRIKVGFGWGTKLTNNVGLETLSIVMKAVKVISVDGNEVNNWLVKLSDNLNKAMGPEEEVKLYVDVFDYTNTEREFLEV